MKRPIPSPQQLNVIELFSSKVGRPNVLKYRVALSKKVFPFHGNGTQWLPKSDLKWKIVTFAYISPNSDRPTVRLKVLTYRRMNKTRTSGDIIEDFSRTLTHIDQVVIGTLLIFLCAATIIGNALVLISFAMDKKLRTLTNYFLLSLAVADVMIATFSMPLFIAYLLIGEWTFGPVVCDMWLAQDSTCSNASCMNLLMIGFDRYFSVTNPLKYRAQKTRKRVGIMISIVWIVAFLLWPPWIYAWPYIEGRRTVPDDDCYIQFLETNSYITFIIATLDYYIPVTIMFVLYYKIWRATRRRTKYLEDMVSDYQNESVCLQKTNTSCKTVPGENSISSSNVHNSNQNNFKSTDEQSTSVSLLGTAPKGEIWEDGDTVSEHVERISDTNAPSESNTKSLNESADSSKASFFKKDTTKQTDKAARVLTAILLAFLVTTTPYNVLTIIKHFDKTHLLVPDYLMNFASFLFYFNSTLNPVCYALANENFRKTYWQILKCTWSKRSRYASQSKNSLSANYVTSFV